MLDRMTNMATAATEISVSGQAATDQPRRRWPMNVRELCRLLSATLHIPGADDEGNYETRQQPGPGAEISRQASCERGAAGRNPAMETMAGNACHERRDDGPRRDP